MSRGLCLLPLTNSSSPGGRSSNELLVSMLCMLIHTLSAFCTGLHPSLPRRSRQMIPLEYMCGWIGIGRSGSLSNVTSGGSLFRRRKSARVQSTRNGNGRRTDRVCVRKDEFEPVDAVLVDRVLIEDSDIECPLLVRVGVDERDARRKAMVCDLIEDC